MPSRLDEPTRARQSIVFVGLTATAMVLLWATLLAGYQWGYSVGYAEGRARQSWPLEQLRQEYDPIWPVSADRP